MPCGANGAGIGAFDTASEPFAFTTGSRSIWPGTSGEFMLRPLYDAMCLHKKLNAVNPLADRVPRVAGVNVAAAKLRMVALAVNEPHRFDVIRTWW